MRKARKINKRLYARRREWSAMASKPKIGDGHRDITGYKEPGSNKK